MNVVLWLAIWITGISWVFLIFPVFHLMLDLPHRSHPVPPWRWVAGLEIGMPTTFLTLSALSEGMEVYEGDEVLWSAPEPDRVHRNHLLGRVIQPDLGNPPRDPHAVLSGSGDPAFPTRAPRWKDSR